MRRVELWKQRERRKSCTVSCARWQPVAATFKPANETEFVEAQNDGYRTGPEIGAKTPDFTLPDQTGRSRSLHDLTGPNGLLLVFSRSADW